MMDCNKAEFVVGVVAVVVAVVVVVYATSYGALSLFFMCVLCVCVFVC